MTYVLFHGGSWPKAAYSIPGTKRNACISRVYGRRERERRDSCHCQRCRESREQLMPESGNFIGDEQPRLRERYGVCGSELCRIIRRIYFNVRCVCVCAHVLRYVYLTPRVCIQRGVSPLGFFSCFLPSFFFLFFFF